MIGNAKGEGLCTWRSTTGVFRHALQRFGQPGELELPLEHLAFRLPEQGILRIPAREDLVEEPARRLHLPVRFRLSRVSLEHEAGDPRDLAELALRELDRVEAREHVLEKVLRGEEAAFQ
jgi:hypothetical protein